MPVQSILLNSTKPNKYPCLDKQISNVLSVELRLETKSSISCSDLFR